MSEITPDISEANELCKHFFSSVQSFVKKNYGYDVQSWYGASDLEENELYLFKNCTVRSFYLCISNKLLKRIFKKEEISFEPEKFKLYVGKEFSDRSKLITNKDDFDRAILNLGILREWDEEEAIAKSKRHSSKKNSSGGLFKKIGKFF